MMNTKIDLLKIALIDAEYFLCKMEIAKDENPDLDLSDAILKAQANVFALKNIINAAEIG